MTLKSSAPTEEQSNLRSGTIGLPGVLFQSITTMAPASAVSFSLIPAVPYAGAALPLAVAITLVVSVLIALNIGELARHLPSAGGFFTYISRSLGSVAGWVTGWIFDLAYLLIVPLQLLVLVQVANSLLPLGDSSWSWVIWAVIFAVVIFLLTYFGIKVSADVGVVLGCIEIGVFLLLALWLIADAGSRNTLAAFNPASSMLSGFSGWQGVMLGMIFAVLAFGGYESAAPLAEETRNPRRIVPLAIVLAALLIGLFYVLCSYAAVVGWGPDRMSSYASNPNPWGEMAKRVWGGFSIIVDLAILNSALANSNAGVNAVSRVLYAMGRVRALPGVLAHLNRFASPDVAIIFTMVVGLVLTVALGLAFGLSNAFAFIGTIIALPFIVVYLATCVAVPVFYLREHRSEFNLFRHILLPLIPAVVLLIVLWFQATQQYTPPVSWAFPLATAWLVIGIIIALVLRFLAPEVLKSSSKVYVEAE
uniref:Amino acid transporter n=1 Tax=Thermogemmatispora argillosa TaxID=2045280 RepID=A0A455T1F5_9CHLR|nr:amino acid transporter [Thermogemmatispora argillosa]